MKKSPDKTWILLGFATLVVMMVGGLFILNFVITKNYSQSVDELNVQTQARINQVSQRLDFVENKSTQERKLLEQQMLGNFNQLQQSINLETGKVKLDLESQLKDVSVKVQEQSLELDSRISELNVKSSDFSSIIEDVLRGVVAIKSNQGSGSGVIFDNRGYVMTNRHVIQGASSLVVVDYQGNQYNAVIVALAQDIDLAVLKIISTDVFTALAFAPESSIKVGSKVIAVGNPLGLSFTVTEGIISSKERLIENQLYLQTDVPINEGNSGGPLVNSAKKIVGINTFKISNTEGLGFAIPSSVAKDMAMQVLEQE